ncbi:hypothetical protein F9L33_14705 [Amylibacter sp. SFDW26]|uniref:alginate export family protein n=1 Tax=Amylibacter sp. SFDW26 TaxID=2652722 RepID=UPI001261EC3A|nr:alginate export family protein [Amylibacter sp. SFDW26]KAB7610142.1 hypothetical protein F9L33_14705 [Amylibacter sp. SFDW26]
MMCNISIKVVSGAILFGILTGDFAYAGSRKPIKSPLVFDLITRKKTRIVVNDYLSFSGSVGVSYLRERNLKLDDLVNDEVSQYKAVMEIVGRAELSEKLIAFTHLEFGLKGKDTHIKSYGVKSDIRAKEAFLAYQFARNTTLSFGRIRLSDKNKWVADKAVDGIHYGRRLQNSGFEFAIFKDDDGNNSSYVLAHYTRFQNKQAAGIYAIAQRVELETNGHIIGYVNNQRNKRFKYTANIAGTFSNAQSAARNGFGFDFRATQRIGQHKLNPQITYGLAVGSKGFRQTGLESNKTKDGGQTLCHRYGFVYQPDLTNMAVASVGFAVRPSKTFSIDLNTYAYAQVSKQATTPAARISGVTTGRSAFLGAEVSLIGAWRPTKKAKVEFGIGVFQAGSAYQNKSSSKRIYLRATRYF